MELKRRKIFGGASLWLCAFLAAYAAPLDYKRPEPVNFCVKQGLWSDAKNWDKKAVPQGFQSAYIGAGQTVTVSDVVNLEAHVLLGTKGDPKPAVLHIVEGARMRVGGLYPAHALRPNDAGSVFMSGGRLDTGNGKDIKGMLMVGTGDTYSGTALFEISGGAFKGGILLGSLSDKGQSGLLRVKGSAPQVSSGEKVPNYFTLQKNGTLEFVMDANAVAKLDFSSSRAIFAGGRIRVDGKAYAGGSAKVMLLIAGRFDGQPPEVECVNFAPRYKVSSSVEKMESGISLVLNIATGRP